MTFTKEFKEAIVHLPDVEKNKLLLRLLKKDFILVQRLEFELLSNQSIADKRAEVKQLITSKVYRMTKSFYSPGYLNMDIRDASGSITRHIKITQDKFGEASLNLHLLVEVLKGNSQNISNATPTKANNLIVALLARSFKVIILIHKLHEDYFLDVKDDLKELGNLMADNHYIMANAISRGFDINWLLLGDIPENIEKIHKGIKERGYLS